MVNYEQQFKKKTSRIYISLRTVNYLDNLHSIIRMSGYCAFVFSQWIQREADANKTVIVIKTMYLENSSTFAYMYLFDSSF